jgi:hypothetical protein
MAFELMARIQALRENPTTSWSHWNAERTTLEYYATLLTRRGRIKAPTRERLGEELDLLRRQVEPASSVAPESPDERRHRIPASKADDEERAERVAYDLLDDLAVRARFETDQVSIESDRDADLMWRSHLLVELAPLRPATRKRLRSVVAQIMGVVDEADPGTEATRFWSGSVRTDDSSVVRPQSVPSPLEGDMVQEPALDREEFPLPTPVEAAPSWREVAARSTGELPVDESAEDGGATHQDHASAEIGTSVLDMVPAPEREPATEAREPERAAIEEPTRAGPDGLAGHDGSPRIHGEPRCVTVPESLEPGRRRGWLARLFGR